MSLTAVTLLVVIAETCTDVPFATMVGDNVA